MRVAGLHVLVTGATGFIGGHLTERLLTSGARVRALVRSPEKAAHLVARGVELTTGDLTQPETLGPACAGVQVVCHSAAWLGSPYSKTRAWAVNASGTAALAKAAHAARVDRFVHLSSIAVYGPVREGVVTEDSPFWRGLDLYGDSKIAAEEELGKVEGQGLPTVILRPGIVYGPRSRGWTLWCIHRIRKGYPILVAGGKGFARPVFIDNLVDAIVLAMTYRRSGDAFTIIDDDVPWKDWLGYYARMLGRPLRSVPQFAGTAIAATALALARISRTPPRLRPAAVGYTVSRAHYSTEKAQTALGWAPRIPLHEAMRATEQWLVSEGYIARTQLRN